MAKKILRHIRDFLKEQNDYLYLWMLEKGLRKPEIKAAMVESTNICNLDCRFCVNKKQKRTYGSMSFENFKKILDILKKKGVKRIDLDHMGEPLLNKEIFKMVRYAKENNIETFFSSNGVYIDEYLEDFLDSGLDELLVSIDGMSEETYLEYRRNSDFKRVITNITKLAKEKKKRGLEKPEITISFIVMKHNEHEIEKMKMFANRLDVNVVFKSLHLHFVPENERKEAEEKYLPTDTRYNRYAKNEPKTVCPFARQIVITQEGDIIPCCMSWYAEPVLGNILKEPEILESEKFRKWIVNIGKRKLSLCKGCIIGAKDMTEIYNSKTDS